MGDVTLNGDLYCDALTVPKSAAMRMMDEANESQMKIYMYLLMQGQSGKVTVESIADYFNYSESDVKRALRFWNNSPRAEREAEVSMKIKVNSSSNDKGDNVVAFSVRPTYSKAKMEEFASIPEISQLLFVAEQYIGKPLKSDDILSMLYMYDELGFSADLIEHLLEYCISNNKKTFRAMENTALEWKELNVASVEDAKKLTRQIPKEMPEVLSAFGLDSKKQLIDAEIVYVRKWTESFGFGLDIIKEACSRTVMTIGKADFRYANGILKGWHDANVKTIADVLTLDDEYRQKKVSDQMMGKPAAGKSSKEKDTKPAQPGKFHNFSEREYDYASLMKDVISN